MVDFPIRKPSEACASCEGPFENEQPMFSMIVLGENEPGRRDVCVPCFESRDVDAEREFAFWRTRRSVDGPERRPIDFNVLRDLFFRMVEHHGGEYGKLCYLLGLVLLRKRVVKLEEFISEDGRDYLVVTSKSRPEPLKLEAPELVPSEFDELREKLMALLDVDLDDDAAPGADAALEAVEAVETAPAAESSAEEGASEVEGSAAGEESAEEAASA